MINWDIGSGGDYSSWGAALVALASASPLADDYTLTQISDTTEPGVPWGGPGYGPDVDLNGHSVVFDSDNPHNGDPTAGWLASCAVANTANIGISVFGSSGSLEIKNLKVRNSAGIWDIEVHVYGSASAKVHDIIASGANTSFGNAFVNLSATASLEVWNFSANEYNGVGAITTDGTEPITVENCVGMNSVYGFRDSGTGIVTFNSCVAFGNAIGDFDNGWTNMFVYNSYSEDGSVLTEPDGGSGNASGINPATEFVSTTYSNPDYLKVVPGGTLATGGITPTITGNTAGVRGDARPGADAQTSAGVDEYSPPSPSIRSGGGGGGGNMLGVVMAAISAGY